MKLLKQDFVALVRVQSLSKPDSFKVWQGRVVKDTAANVELWELPVGYSLAVENKKWFIVGPYSDKQSVRVNIDTLRPVLIGRAFVKEFKHRR